MIAIIDYGAGNLRSVQKALDFVGAQSRVVSSPAEAGDADRIILPGVGAFGAAAARLRETGFFEYVREWLLKERPFLGICLGMQLLMQSSTESEGVEGLGLFEGGCERFASGKVPQIGWNQVAIGKKSKLFEGIEDESFFYFLHGYFVAPEKAGAVAATTTYGVTYPSMLEQGNIRAVQFHPEKSGGCGLVMLKNWVASC